MKKNLEKHFKPTKIPEGFEEISHIMRRDYEIILSELEKRGYKTPEFPDVEEKSYLDGIGAALAYPIQGILKYHGMSDWDNRIAYLPSVSLNNSAAYTKTYVEFDRNLEKDIVIINEEQAEGRELERVKQVLNTLRAITNTNTKAIVVSENYAQKKVKGLGTSASGSAALSLASIDASLGKEYVNNTRFTTVISRYLAGSGCRSASGGLSLWLSYPGIESANSYSIRLNNDNLGRLGLITIPVESRIGLKTEEAHRDAPNSEFFKQWMLLRKEKVIDLLNAVEKADLEKIGQIAELDTMHLHGVTMSGQKGKEKKIIAWEPETINLMRIVNNLRDSDIPVYYSIDTGPTPVFLTDKKYVDEICNELEKKGFSNYLKSEIAGKPKILDYKETKEELFTSKVVGLIK